MHKKSKSVQSYNEDYENKILIEKWMKRNSSSHVTIGQNVMKLDDSSRNAMLISNANDIPLGKLKPNVSDTTIQKIDQEAVSNNILSNKPTEKQTNDILSKKIKCNILKRKVAKQSTKSTDVQLIKQPIDTNVVNRKSNPENEEKLVAPKISKTSCNVKWINNSTDNMKVDQKMNGKLPPTMQCNEIRLSSIAQDKQNVEKDMYNKSSIKYLLCKEKDGDVYTSLLENYRYLITPKSWSVIEFTSETKERYIVFFNVHVIKENDTLISVMRKSLIISKGAAINYSVHGLPVDIKGTILPKTLDNTKKLLSILHIFDKMQVCDGLGSDLNIMQTDFVFKDNCRYWRHKHCKVILVKAMRCLICTETRNLLLERKVIFKDKIDDTFNGLTAKKH